MRLAVQRAQVACSVKRTPPDSEAPLLREGLQGAQRRAFSAAWTGPLAMDASYIENRRRVARHLTRQAFDATTSEWHHRLPVTTAQPAA